MKAIQVKFDIPVGLHQQFKQSNLHKSCNTTSEAIRAAIRKVVETESSLKETTGNRANNGEYHNGQ